MANRVASEQELNMRANLRSQLFLFAGQYRFLNAAWLTKCLEATPEQLTNQPNRIHHVNSVYKCDVPGKTPAGDEEYHCLDCGAIWYLEIPVATQ